MCLFAYISHTEIWALDKENVFFIFIFDIEVKGFYLFVTHLISWQPLTTFTVTQWSLMVPVNADTEAGG